MIMKKSDLSKKDYDTFGEYLVLLALSDSKAMKYKKALHIAIERSKEYNIPLYVCMVVTKIDCSKPIAIEHKRLYHQLSIEKTRRKSWKRFFTKVFRRLKK